MRMLVIIAIAFILPGCAGYEESAAKRREEIRRRTGWHDVGKVVTIKVNGRRGVVSAFDLFGNPWVRYEDQQGRLHNEVFRPQELLPGPSN